MSSEIDTGLLDHQDLNLGTRDTLWLKTAQFLRKRSQFFGWPMLLLFGFGPMTPGNLPYREWVYFYCILGLPFLLLSLALRIWARGYLRAEGFVLDGPYRYVRNPVELGTLFAYLGFGIVLGLSIYYLFFCLFMALFFLSLKGSLQDRELYSRMGGIYLRYKSRVRRWIPSRLPGMNRSDRSFSFIQGLRYESDSLLWILGYAVVFAIRRHREL